MAQIESLENELRIALSEEAIQKAKMMNQRKLDESRKQHYQELEKLKVSPYYLNCTDMLFFC